MLDIDTKRRIDTARDILVGKVPDPKSQVEQITIALIYKFMDDMDAESEAFGGKRKFFTSDYARYGWATLMAPSLGGHEMLALYGEGIARMPENPGIPALFRDIFKNAYLPYRDPETLKAFLKIINEFSYDHSERLGDAFEYLLSVLGSQGDAGQFRTPRHIIDFMVAVLDPKKHETVLDPACGTAGFLISAYKHILRSNTDAKGHSTLTPDDKGRLACNFKGYDISPDMVRLSLVNLYLHGFTDPHIYEYDTLTSEERWNEFADVILANPPFMSPKGGIKPHKRFSIQAKRSEVLFVDYMAEHLTPTGRAAIIVPEGIIFQSQGAYKALRKLLLESSLVAVVSLPAGCFNPYSGVKTSILFLDKSLARQSEGIGFFKVENDGFGLGAQRRAIEKNDLPQVQAEIAAYLRALRNRESTESVLAVASSAQIVAKEKVAANGDYNFSGERYREGMGKATTFSRVRLADICDAILTGPFGSSLHESDYVTNGIPVINPKNIVDGIVVEAGAKMVSMSTRDRLKEFTLRENDIVIARRGEMGRCAVVSAGMNGWLCGTGCFVIRLKPICELGFAYLQLRSPMVRARLEEQAVGVTLLNLNQGILADLEIPLPPLEVQKEIVAEIEGYQKVINGARAVLDHYRPHIPIHPDWPMVELGEITKPEYGFTEKAAENGDARFIRITDIAHDGKLQTADPKFITVTPVARECLLSTGDILVARTGATFGKTMIFEETYPAVFASFLIRLRFPKERVLPRFYWVFAQSELYWSQANALMTGGGQPQFNGNALVQVKIPLPPLDTQKAIVAEIEAEQALVAANRELITRFEQKIQATLSRVWGESDSAADVPACSQSH